MGDPSAQASENGSQDDEALRADELMADIARPAIGKMLLISAGVHLLVLLLTSIRFISLCIEHHTMNPRAVITAIKQEQHEKELEAKREAAREKILAARKKKKADTEKGPRGEEAQPKADAGKDKPKVIRDIEAKSKERPAKSDVTLDELKDLE